MDEHKTVTLPSGRVLSYAECGVPDGTPVFFFHGHPGSRLDCRYLDAAAVRRWRVRLIAPDRPGVGRSDFVPRRRIFDWPADVCALADALRIHRFAVLGLSGGGPYAAACALAIPERLIGAGIVSGDGPKRREWLAQMGPGRYLFILGRLSPALAGMFLRLMRSGLRDPGGMIARLMPYLPPADQEILSQPGMQQAFVDTFAETFHGGVRGPAWDVRLASMPWDLHLEDIAMPVCLWHGGADRNVPLDMARWVAGAIPGCRPCFYPEEGHFLIARHTGEILSTLLA